MDVVKLFFECIVITWNANYIKLGNCLGWCTKVVKPCVCLLLNKEVDAKYIALDSFMLWLFQGQHSCEFFSA